MKREPLLSGDVIPVKLRSPEEVDAMHEKARAKDAELIQELFDALVQPIVSMDAPIEMLAKAKGAIELAYAHGFKPTEQ